MNAKVLFIGRGSTKFSSIMGMINEAEEADKRKQMDRRYKEKDDCALSGKTCEFGICDECETSLRFFC